MAHILITDSENGAVLIDADVALDEKVTSTKLGTDVNGVIYKDVTAWVSVTKKAYDWEPDGHSVFVQWEDQSDSDPTQRGTGSIVHTAERPVPGGGVARFLIAAEV